MDEWATLLYNGGWNALSQGRYDVAEQMVWGTLGKLGNGYWERRIRLCFKVDVTSCEGN